MAAEKAPIKVAVTGAAGQIGYSLLPLIASGQMFGADQPVIMNCIEVNFDSVMKRLKGTLMEMQDCAYPLLVQANGYSTDEPEAAWSDIDYAVLVGGFPRKDGMTRADLLQKNANIFKECGENLEKYAKTTTKVLVVANPANTNCGVVAHYAQKIPKKNFCALTRLDFNRATGIVANRSGVAVSQVKNIVIWGNHSKTQVPDVSNATVDGQAMELDEFYTSSEEGNFIHTVQYRGASVIKMRGLSSAVSAANAAKDNIRDWHCGTAEGETVAMSVWSNGNQYGVPDGLFYSFPCTVTDGEWAIADGFDPDNRVRALMEASTAELQENGATALNFLQSAESN